MVFPRCAMQLRGIAWKPRTFWATALMFVRLATWVWYKVVPVAWGLPLMGGARDGLRMQEMWMMPLVRGPSLGSSCQSVGRRAPALAAARPCTVGSQPYRGDPYDSRRVVGAHSSPALSSCIGLSRMSMPKTHGRAPRSVLHRKKGGKKAL